MTLVDHTGVLEAIIKPGGVVSIIFYDKESIRVSLRSLIGQRVEYFSTHVSWTVMSHSFVPVATPPARCASGGRV